MTTPKKMASPSPTDWRSKAQQKRNAILAAIPEEWHIPKSTLDTAPADLTSPGFIQQFLSPGEIEITEAPVSGILARTTTGTWSAAAVTSAFAHRAAVAHQLTGCVSEFLLAPALAAASALDAHFARHRAPLGPLHGLPVSLKDSVDLEGVGTSLGFTAWSGDGPASRDAVIAAALRRQGAVFHVKTAVPQASFAAETFGAVSGYVASPLRRGCFSAGGSSGGEAALLALRGSVLGLGTDIGGSIRWPASGIGAYGLRPSTGRLPYAGIASVVGGLEALTDVRFAAGPMAAAGGDNATALRALVAAVLADEPWLRDPLVAEMPWRQDAYYEAARQEKKLVVGVAPTDGVVTPHPPVLRAVETVAAALRAQGHAVVPIPPDAGATQDAIDLWSSAAYADLSHAHAQFRASGEPADRLMPPAFDPDKKAASSPPLGADGVQRVNVRIRRYREECLRRWMGTAELEGNDTGRAVDVVITPVAPYSAARIGGIRYIGYPLPVVLNDQTAAVLPVLTTDKAIDVVRPLEIPEGIRDEYVRANKKVHQDYDPELYHGMPVNVQVVGRRFQEEKVLAITEYIDRLLRGGGVKEQDTAPKL
ncbi:hypothetical protein KVR01_011849 [Diaporthe batatas]|uniref:uncharacterized protein n=1 Tax=Diaporthe batatas TaxID=748121 RepID=UPI001D046549|nr:uncharacterized protein KVR01_011849 [Diaporthe batatas]KAG8158088.1 hypothetical protein KVR01_011849 [Diaporthe batatas]